MTIEELKAQLDALRAARYSGMLTVKAGDKWLTYKSDAEMQAAIHDLEREIANAEGRRSARRIRVYTSKEL